KLNAIEKDRQSLHSEVASTSMVEGSTFHEDVFDIVRKNMGNDQKISQAIQQRFALSRLPDETVRRLQSYVKATDEFSPGVFIPRREVANLNEAPMGGFTADVIGLGASNLKGTSEALARSKNLDQVLVEARQAEQSVTKQFIEQKKYFEDAVKKSVDSGKLKTICSGDDCVAIAVKPLSETDKKNILRNLADSPYSGKFRLAFVSEGVRDPLVRNTLSTHGESVEKLLRSALGTVMEPRKLKGLTFGLDMRTQNLNSGSVKLLIGEASEVRLTTQERNLIQKKFAEALQEFNQDFANKGVASSYLPY
ncbi:MAG TPA: hypothetical protein VN132_06700, partial [Bdellovibrio sp.]|nr:hypothetical protein [Bdellovibrio sp.]